MKEIYYFFKWIIVKISIGGILFSSAIAADVASLFFSSGSTIKTGLILYGITLPLLIALKVLLYDFILDLWDQYKQEKAQLLKKLSEK